MQGSKEEGWGCHQFGIHLAQPQSESALIARINLLISIYIMFILYKS